MNPAPAGDLHAMLEVLIGGALEAVADVLESRPELAAPLHRALIPPSTRSPQPASNKFMSVKEYTAHARLSDRTIRDFVKNEMQEGLHFHRDGRSGRRIIIHVSEADHWRAARSFVKEKARRVEELATNEVLRRRAQVALKKAGLR